MAIIVEHQATTFQYALIGTGYSHYKDTITGYASGHWQTSKVEEDTAQMVAVCDAKGILHWLPSCELTLISEEE